MTDHLVLATLTMASLGLMAYVHVGYAAVVTLLSWLAPRPLQPAPGATPFRPTMSLIISAYDEVEVISEKIENSLALDYPHELLEIMVVTDGSSDGTPELARLYEDQGVKVLHDPRRAGKSAAMSRAAAIARGEILVFSDANAFYDKDALAELARALADPEVGAVSGKKTVERHGAAGDSGGLYWRYESFIKERETLLGSTVSLVGEMMAMRRELFAPIPQGIINDDAWLTLRILRQGYRVVYAPRAVCREAPALTTDDEAVRRKRISAGRFQLMLHPGLWPWNNPLALFEYLSHKVLRLMLPLLMAGALVPNLILVWQAPDRALFTLLLAGQVAFYLLASAGWLMEHSVGGAGWLKPARLAWYVVSGSLAPFSGILGFMRGRQSALWDKVDRSTQASGQHQETR